jgi:hypothetical protein
MDEGIISNIKFDIIIKYINLICPSEYNSKYSNEYYLKNILFVHCSLSIQLKQKFSISSLIKIIGFAFK